jgi:hypothetical protein
MSDYSAGHNDYAEEAAQLVKMGFTDRAQNKKVLAENRGDVRCSRALFPALDQGSLQLLFGC